MATNCHSTNEITQLLNLWAKGNQGAFNRVVTLVYSELSGKARKLIDQERTDHILEGAALVHEAYLRLRELGEIHWRDRHHFFAVAAGAMRRILVDHARASGTSKRGGGAQHVPLDEVQLADRPCRIHSDILALDAALTRLSERDVVQARVVELRYFVGFTVEETAETLGISPATVKRKWNLARTELHRELDTQSV